MWPLGTLPRASENILHTPFIFSQFLNLIQVSLPQIREKKQKETKKSQSPTDLSFCSWRFFFGLSGFYGWNLQRISEEQPIGRESWDQVRGKLFDTWLLSSHRFLSSRVWAHTQAEVRIRGMTPSLVMRSQSSPQLNTVVQRILQCSTAFADLTPGVCFTLVG